MRLSRNPGLPTDNGSHKAYDPRYFEKLAAIDDRHFWFRSRNRVLCALAGEVTKAWEPGYYVLEVGCGNGNVLRFLQSACRSGHVIGMDLFEEGLQHARHRTQCSLVQGDLHAPPYARKFELIGIFDVLEHIVADRQVLQDLHDLLAPEGLLLLTVPAHMSLWSYFDECGHVRRYSRMELMDKLLSTGFEVLYLTEFMFILFPLMWLGRRITSVLKRLGGGEGTNPTNPDFTVVPLINGLLTAALMMEIPLLLRRHRLPLGSSLLAIARRKDTDL